MFMHTNAVRTFFSIEPIRNPAAGHTDPFAYGWYNYGPTPGNEVTTTTIAEDIGYFNTTHSGTAYRMKYTGEGNSGNNLLEQSQAAQVDDISGELYMTDIGFVCSDIGARGQRGASTDIWWGPYQVASTGDTFPVDANNRQFVIFGSLVLPWTGDSTIPVTI